MSEKPGNYPKPPPTIGNLKAECHRLVEIVSHRPGAMKLLLGCRAMLATFAAYKANRGDRFRPRSIPDE